MLILAKKLNDDKLVQTIYKLNDIELSQFSIEDLMESIDKKDTEVKNNEMKKMRVRHREKTVKVLVKKLVNIFSVISMNSCFFLFVYI